eukprot:CAMPEP_0197294386 /NCGR_PEP_ID=MMETSP0890-20130614/32238_1 /TAXON_ID=44058 ORGANISM="Aureoumbra lagunensis, Strain CCMP1510" /NCGR_SAMPLE_ID=MMETSP0890 /ASSEMBLY_ACC=CAM_ASM_000533 /LENGTH=46 /DNA_ID= /DNA_START= /DNA_END= /DNA_ORIENTATION=
MYADRDRGFVALSIVGFGSLESDPIETRRAFSIPKSTGDSISLDDS